MGPGRVSVLMALLLCLVYFTGPSQSFGCEPPAWRETGGIGPNPFPALEGKVVLVALLKGYCGYCIHQAQKMYQLKNQLMSQGFPDIDMLIINGGEERSRDLVDNLVEASPLSVIQDSLDHDLYNRVFRGRKDDFLVYDRCNQAAIYIPHPFSDLDRNTTKIVLKAVHRGRHSCYCSLDYAPRNAHDRMQGDDPGDLFYQTHNMNRNMLECNAGDTECAQFQMAINRYSRRGSRGSIMRQRGRFRRILNSVRRRYQISHSADQENGGRFTAGRARGALGRRRNMGARWRERMQSSGAFPDRANWRRRGVPQGL